jgi:polyferredoxin
MGFVVYHFMNPFNLFDMKFETPTILVTVILALGFALITYRPFCQFICPFGFVSWLAERLSLVRVRVNLDRCNGCGALFVSMSFAVCEAHGGRKGVRSGLLQLCPMPESLSRRSDLLRQRD